MRSRTLRAVVFPWIASLLVACAAGQRQGCRHDNHNTSGDTDPQTTGVTTSVTTDGTGGEIDDGTVLGIDRDVTAALAGVYGQARRIAWKHEGAPGSSVYTLEYELARAHAKADVAPLRSALSQRGFEIDRILDDAQVSTVFAAKGGAPVSVTVDIGASRLTVTVELGG